MRLTIDKPIYSHLTVFRLCSVLKSAVRIPLTSYTLLFFGDLLTQFLPKSLTRCFQLRHSMLQEDLSRYKVGICLLKSAVFFCRSFHVLRLHQHLFLAAYQ